MGTKLSAEDKIGLSPDEIAALESSEADELLAKHGGSEEGGADTGTTAEAGATDDAGTNDDAAGTEAAAEEGAAEGSEAGADAEALSADQLAEVVDEGAKPAPAPKPFKVEELDYAAERKKLADAKAEVERKWGAGEEGCTDEWRLAELERIDAERDELLIRHTRATTLREQNEQAEAQRREVYESVISAEVGKLLEASKKAGAAVPYASDKKAQAQFDNYLKAVETDPDAADLSPAQRVAEAHRLVMARRGIAAAPAPAPAPAAAPATPARREVPVTLSGLPNAGRENQDQDLLAELSTLSGEDYEMRLASLPAGTVEKLLRRADNAAATA